MLVVSAAGVAIAALPTVAMASSGRFRPATANLAPEPNGSVHLPVLTAPQAITLLNQQRIANGIPGDLVEEPTLSSGCLSWATVYRPAKGQYPHEELPSQPGYTAEGNEAAASSDLDGEPGTKFTVGTLWGPLFNPWSGAAIHLAGLMNPTATTAWYGATASAACMGTGGSRTFTTPTFFSVPGPGATNVPIAQNTGEEPYSPQQAAGLRTEYSAPAIILFAEGTDAKLQNATLTSATGSTVSTKDITPESPAPPSAPGFVPSATFGFTASYVVPTTKFKPDTTYVMTATWQNGQGVSSTQTVQFKTAATDLNGLIEADEKAAQFAGIETGAFTPTLKGRVLTIVATGLAIGRNVTAQMLHCPIVECGVHPDEVSFKRTIRLSATAVRLKIPQPPRGKRSVLELLMAPFRVKGKSVYPAEPSLLLPRR